MIPPEPPRVVKARKFVPDSKGGQGALLPYGEGAVLPVREEAREQPLKNNLRYSSA